MLYDAENEEDFIILKKIKSGDKVAFADLFAKYHENLTKFAFHKVKRVDVAEELVSDVFYNIWRKREEVGVCKNLKAYLFTSVKNLALNFLKKDQKLTGIITDESNYPIEEKNALEELIQQESRQKSEQIFRKMPQPMGLILKLRYVYNYKYSEIARHLDLSEKKVEYALFTGRKHFISVAKKLDKGH